MIKLHKNSLGAFLAPALTLALAQFFIRISGAGAVYYVRSSKCVHDHASATTQPIAVAHKNKLMINIGRVFGCFLMFAIIVGKNTRLRRAIAINANTMVHKISITIAS